MNMELRASVKAVVKVGSDWILSSKDGKKFRIPRSLTKKPAKGKSYLLTVSSDEVTNLEKEEGAAVTKIEGPVELVSAKPARDQEGR